MLVRRLRDLRRPSQGWTGCSVCVPLQVSCYTLGQAGGDSPWH